jgi:hypothetical protein
MRYVLPFFLTLLDADLIRAALRHADISITKACVWMDMDPAQFERQLNGEGHLSHKRLLMLPLKFINGFPVECAMRYGPPQRSPARDSRRACDGGAPKRMLRITQLTRRQLAARKEA